MALTDIQIRNAKPGPKPIKMFDERGLFILLQPSGGKLWRLKYRFERKEKKLSLGIYPDVPLKEARLRRDQARTEIANGIDPAAKKQAKLKARQEAAANSFEALGEEYIAKREKEGLSPTTIGKSRWLLSLLVPHIGKKPVSGIKPAELLTALEVIQNKGHLETARRMRSFASRVFRYAVATSRAENDPAQVLRGALIAPTVKHHAAILEPDKVGELLRAIDTYQGEPLTYIALKMVPHVFVRPGELRHAEWHEFDFAKAVWTISAEKMKMRQPHKVPFSKQVLELLESAKAISSGQKYVFSSLYYQGRPMSENTINGALRRLGYSKDEMTAHGFRSTASTLLNESGKWNPDAIKRALAHNTSSSVRGTYHRGAYWEERVKMAQWWSDHLDQLQFST